MEKRTTSGEMKVRTKEPVIWYDTPKPRRGEELLKNLAVASALVLCAVTLKSGALPGAESAADAVIASVSDDTLLDDRLGKLSFVSTLFPEATLVFGETDLEELALPVAGGLVAHVWSENEPYIAWRSDHREVYAAHSGVVMGVYHGEDEERLVQVRGDNGLTCMYGNLDEVYASTGDEVRTGDVLGLLIRDADCVLEVQQDGVSIDPSILLRNAR